MNMKTAQDLVNSFQTEVRQRFMDTIASRLTVSGAFGTPSQLNILVTHFSLARYNGITTRSAVDIKELEAAVKTGGVSVILKGRAQVAAEELLDLFFENCAKVLAWGQASRWQRLKWAWAGRICT